MKAIFAAVVAALTITGAACADNQGGVEKAGGKPAPRAIRLGTVEDSKAPYADEVKHFADEIESLSGSTLDVEIVWEAAGEYTAQSEKDVADLVKDGKLDLAVVPTRVWDKFGVTTMQALQTPFLIDSLELANRITSSKMAAEMMAGLEPLGLDGLALWPESLRHPLGIGHPLLTPSDFAGARLRVPISDASYRLARAIGVEPVDPPDWDAAIAAGELQGFESAFLWTTDLPTVGTFTANVTFYPKVNAIVMNAHTYDGLSGEQQTSVRQAATETIDFLTRTHSTDKELAAKYCSEGGSVALASADTVASLTSMAEPVVVDMERDATTKRLVDEIRSLKAEMPANGEAVPMPCGPETAADSSTTSQPAELAAFPEGVYRTDSPRDGIVTFTFLGGVWNRLASPNGPVDCSADYVVKDGRVYLTTSSDPALDCGNPHGLVFLDATWTLEGDQLRFLDINSDPAAKSEFSLPWTRIEAEATPTAEAFPEGTYRTESPLDGTVTMTFIDGVWDLVPSPQVPVGCRADYEVKDGRIYLTTSSDPALDCGNPHGLVFFDARWTLEGDQLRFLDINSDPAAKSEMSLPWTKIG